MKRFVATFVWMVILLPMTFAAYLKNVPQTLVQPNGDTLHCFATGDEFYHRLHDADGYTIILDKSTGYYVYADKVGDQLVPTSYIAGRANPVTAGLTPNLSISAEQWRALRQKWESSTPVLTRTRAGDWNHGHINNLVVFIRFADDDPFVNSFSSVEAMFNSSTPGYNSMYNYFKSATYDQLTITSTFYPTQSGTTILSYQDEHNRSYFEPWSTWNPEGYDEEDDDERTTREHQLLKRAVNAIADMVPSDLDIDYDHDGYVDNVCFVVRGNVGEWNDLLWPHRWSLYSEYAYINGKRVWTFNFQLADGVSYFRNSVLCHEMNHSLSAPDLYHYYNGTDMQTVGPWDLMENTMDPPQHMGAYMKYKYGNWISEIPEITECGTYSLHSLGSSATNNCYRIASPNDNEFFVLEYRNANDNFEGSLPGSGLLVYRINTDFDGNASYDGETIFDEVYLYRPNGTPTDNGNIYQAAFSANEGRTEMNANTNPYPFLTDGTVVSVGDFTLRDISTAGGEVMTFTVCQSGSATQVPTVTTNTVSSIGSTSAICGGNVTSTGGGSVTARGVCWSTSPNPTIANSHTTNGTGTGTFTSNITGLTPNTTYYVRAYATNSAGTGYGAQRSFTTSTASGPIVDYQLWGFIDNTEDQNSISELNLDMDEDLYTHFVLYNDGPDVPDDNDVIYFDIYIDGQYVDYVYLMGSQLYNLTSGYASSISGTLLYASTMDDLGLAGSFELCLTVRIDGAATDPVSDNNTICITVNRGSSDEPIVDYQLWGFIDNTTDLNYITELNLDAEEDLAPFYVLYNGGPDVPNDDDVIYFDLYIDGQYMNNMYLMGSQLSSLPSGYYSFLYGTIYTASAMDDMGLEGSFELCISLSIYGAATDPDYSNNTICITVNRGSSIHLPTVSTNTITSITPTSASGGGNVTDDGGAEVTARGVCWSTSPNPTIANSHTTNGTGTGTFTSSITNLTPNTTYYVRAYATNEVGTGYGEDVSFTTACNAVNVTVNGNTDVCEGGSVTLTASGANTYQWDNGDQSASIIVTPASTTTYTVVGTNQYGCTATASITVNTHEIPAVAITGDSIFCQVETTTLTATGADSYRWSTGDETPNITVTPSLTTTYTVTGTNQHGCSASASITISISNLLPSVTTADVSAITSTSAISGGDVVCAGASDVTARGVCWSMSQNPTIADSHTTDGTGTGSFTSSITGLTPNTTYYVRAYATNSEGTTYGNEVSFTTLCDNVVVAINGNTDVCAGESTTLTASGAVTYQWDNGDHTANTTVTPNATITYTVTGTNQYGCSATASVMVTARELPTILVSGDTTICAGGGSTTLTASGAVSYRWSTGATTPSVTIGAFGVYTVTGTSSEGCSSSVSVTVIVSQLPNIVISGSTDFCDGGSTTLTASGGQSYLWSNGATTASITVNEAGPYQVIGYNAAGCSRMAETEVSMWEPASSEFSDTTDQPCYIWNNETYCEPGDHIQHLQTVHGCDSIVTLHLTITTGIANHSDNILSLYPNPTTGTVTLQLTPETCNLKPEIQLFDIYGQRLQIISVNNERIQIDLSRYATGVYLIKLVNNGNVTTVRKVVKE